MSLVGSEKQVSSVMTDQIASEYDKVMVPAQRAKHPKLFG
jgi:hypothetical protein